MHAHHLVIVYHIGVFFLLYSGRKTISGYLDKAPVQAKEG